ncbi:Fungal-trans-2 domain containing protein [Pyrenophora tritici-repentis]|nr:Fungal-trans-2 domain containing protein [Pyrenophora tritici-repentis]PZC96344.1 Fungal-trans-2 domain containing protein [Pyrenophora tritici-repentis]
MFQETIVSNSFDPFDSYPNTRLPRAYVQQLMQHFLSDITFQYYPLDPDMSSNPFVVSWWPLALGDPALFHVSLQTACLDLELKAQRGFLNSEILMNDSVSLVRQRVENPLLRYKDETMDSVVTLAAIEYGKRHIDAAKMHIDGVKGMVQSRGGIQLLKLTSPLTARMVSWVLLILTQIPQFDVQDDFSVGDAIAPIPQWLEATTSQDQIPPYLVDLQLDPLVGGVFFRLRNLFRQHHLSTTDLHDLTCFVLHKLLLPSSTADLRSPNILETSQCVRHATALYMLNIHGTTYFSHAELQWSLVSKLRDNIESVPGLFMIHHRPLLLWILFVGIVASYGTPHHPWFTTEAELFASYMSLQTWDETALSLEEVLWFKSPRTEHIFRQAWEGIMTVS